MLIRVHEWEIIASYLWGLMFIEKFEVVLICMGTSVPLVVLKLLSRAFESMIIFFRFSIWASGLELRKILLSYSKVDVIPIKFYFDKEID